MEARLKKIKDMARNADKKDLRTVIESLADAALDIYKIQTATDEAKENIKKQVSHKKVNIKRKAQPKTLNKS